jgi:UDP-N-acetylglucosamine--N-acetylmuramyl-(pentapeptide) pyrophosphoryl-undecaprenol N-acetylglucosamine transferase
MSEPFVLLSAGGTGGHLFPAEALARALMARGVAVELATDSRAANYAAHFPSRALHALLAATPSGGGLLAKAHAMLTTGRGILAARRLMRRHRPRVVVGFGGYPSVPAVFAATMLGVPTVIHEQNAVIGRANRALAPRVNAIATGFASVAGIAEAQAKKVTHVGNPVRPDVLAAAAVPFELPSGAGRFRLLVFGGSQGARVMADIVPPALEQLTADLRARLAIVQQARTEDIERVREIYNRAGIAAELAPFFTDLPARMAAAQLVICRSGASTVAELAVIGRPSILVPLPGAIDQDQAANAATLVNAAAATVIPQSEFTPARLAEEIAGRAQHPDSLSTAAACARRAAIPDAAERLANLVLARAGLAKAQ